MRALLLPGRTARSRTLSGLLMALCALPGPAQRAAEVAFPPHPDFLVLRYDLSHDMIAEQDPEPLLRIYGDGRVLVHYPSTMKKAGDYELVLTQGELRQLLLLLADRNIPGLDVAALRRERREAEARQRAQQGLLFAISDDTVTHLEIHLERYQPPGGAPAVSNLDRSIEWRNLHSDAERFPGIRGIQDLAAAESEIRELLERPDLVRVP